MNPEQFSKRRRDASAATEGAATGAGSVLTGTGLLAAGVPGAREPDAFRFISRNKGSQSSSRIRSAGRTARTGAPLAQGGILGYRAAAHDSYVANLKREDSLSASKNAVRAGKLEAEESVMRGLRQARKGAHGVTAAGLGLLALGHHDKSRGQVRKRSDDASQRRYANTLGAGAGLSAVGYGVPRALRPFERRYTQSAKDHTQAAEKIAPHFKGLAPGRHGKPTMYPIRPDHNLEWRNRKDPEYRRNAYDKIEGGAKARAKSQAEAGYHRGVAQQHVHFAEAFQDTSRLFRRARVPGVALASVGGTGLVAGRNRKVSKAQEGYGYQSRRVSPLRATEAAVGAGFLGYGLSHSAPSRVLLQAGTAQNGRLGTASRRAETGRRGLQRVTGAGAQVLGRTLGRGVRLRPVETIAVGGALLHNAVPVHRTKFTSVEQRGWPQ